jgi:hypothetical protein
MNRVCPFHSRYQRTLISSRIGILKLCSQRGDCLRVLRPFE